MRAYTADMIPGGASPVINVSQYDNDYAVTVTLIEGAEIYTPPVGATIRVEGTKPDGNGFAYPCTYQGNVVTVPIYTQMTAVAGRFPIELVIYQSGLRVGSCNITLAVERAPLDNDEIISDSDIPAIIALAQAQADAAASSAASAETAKTAAQTAAQELQSLLIRETASGAVASFADGADNIPMQSVLAEITPVQSGTGDPSPSNVRPISGRTGMTVTRCGRNLCEDFTESGICIKQGEHEYKIIKTGTTIAGRSANADCALKANVSYIISLTADTANISGLTIAIRAHTVDGVNTSRISLISNGANEIKYTPTQDIEYLNFYLGTETESIGAYVIIKNLMVRPESITDDTYAPYTGTTIPITWESIAGTVYGGTLDVVSGVLTVDSFYYEVPADSVMQASSGGYQYFSTPNRPVGVAYSEAPVGLYCNRLPSVARSATRTNAWGIAYDTGVDRLQMKLQDITTQADARAWVTDNPLQVVYKLATPQTYQLTPTEVRTLLGGNSIYTDAGDVSVEYVADTKLYIDNIIAELQALILEN